MLLQIKAQNLTGKKLFVPVVTLSTQDNEKILQQLKRGFKITINYDKYQSKITTQAPKRYLDYLNDPSFLGVNRSFILTFDINANSLRHPRC